MKLCDLPRRIVSPLGEWPQEDLTPHQRYVAKNRTAVYARVAEWKRRKRREQGIPARRRAA